MLKNEKLIFTIFGVFIFVILLCAIFIKLKIKRIYICKKNKSVFPIIHFTPFHQTCIAEEVIMAEVVSVK